MLKALRLTVALVALASPALAETGILRVAGYAGSLETTLRAEIIPAFQKKFGVQVDYLPGNSTETLARLPGNVDVAIADDWAIAQAIQAGFCGRIDGLKVDDLHAAARFKDDKAVALGLSATGFMYNTKFFRIKGWEPPASWNDLKDPKYRKLIAMPPITAASGLRALVMLARANGGGEGDIEPGFKAVKEDVGPNVVAYEPALDKIWTLFNRGYAEIVVSGSGRAQFYAASSDFVGFAYPRDGAPAELTAACPTGRPAANVLSSEFVKALLRPRLQELFFRDYGYAPATKSVELPAERASIAPIGGRAASLVTLDWDTINAHRDAWIARWKREIGQ